METSDDKPQDSAGDKPKQGSSGEAGEVVYSKFITLKNGKRLYAHQKGLEAFRFVVKKKRQQ